MDLLTPLDKLDDSHPLLESRTPAYTHATVRRAFIVWLRCGQRNQFKDVCDYYHRLEAMEDQLPTDVRASSRHQEFSLFVGSPPTSEYQQKMFPNLYSTPIENQTYSQAYLQNYQAIIEQKTAARFEEMKEAERRKVEAKQNKVKIAKEKPLSNKDIFEASKAFRSDCKGKLTINTASRIGLAFANYDAEEINKVNAAAEPKMKPKSESPTESEGTSKKDILETSQMIKKYCKDQQVPMRTFLENFKEYASRCELNNTVNNVGFYIKRKMIHAELGFAVKVHRAKVYNGNKENILKNAVPLKNKEATPKCEILNVDNTALINGYAKMTFGLKSKANILPTAKNVSVNNKINKFEKAFIEVQAPLTVLKREIELLKISNTGHLGSSVKKMDILRCKNI